MSKDFFLTFIHVSVLCAQLRVIARTRKRFVEIVAVAERCLIINSCKKIKELKKLPLRIYLAVKLTDGRMSIKKEKFSLYLIYNIVSSSKMSGKTEPFSGKIS